MTEAMRSAAVQLIGELEWRKTHPAPLSLSQTMQLLQLLRELVSHPRTQEIPDAR